MLIPPAVSAPVFQNGVFYGGQKNMYKEGQVRIPSGCAISSIFSKSGERIPGNVIIDSIRVMHDRSNGLGGGFAGYGIYPEYKDYYAVHVFYESNESKKTCESYFESHFDIVNMSKIPTRKTPAIVNEPIIMRYFMLPLKTKLMTAQVDADEYVARCVFKINKDFAGAYVFSSGKNMGVFKAVGFPEDVGEFYELEQYAGYLWTAHGRYPTNTPGWWGGAHPFSLLDLSVVHNGEISSYDTNRRTMETHGYNCTLLTDTEVITYIIDFLCRKKGLTTEEAAKVIAAPFWRQIDRMPEKDKDLYLYLRKTFSSMLITGPFSIIVGFSGGFMALNDRLKLRSMVIGEKGDRIYAASEEGAIRAIAPELDRIWAPQGGEPVIFTLEGGQNYAD